MAFISKFLGCSKLYNWPFSRGKAGVSLFLFSLVHVKVAEIASQGIVETKGFEVPFSGFIWIITTASMSTFEVETAFINVYALSRVIPALIVQ
jgi:hypothetical protein